jgi:hypothetical protein
VQLPQTISGRHRSIAFIAAGVLLLILALVHAGVAMLFALLASSPRRTTLRIGDDWQCLHWNGDLSGSMPYLGLRGAGGNPRLA